MRNKSINVYRFPEADYGEHIITDIRRSKCICYGEIKKRKRKVSLRIRFILFYKKNNSTSVA